MNRNNKLPINTGSFDSILQVVETLRGPNGCPWDKEQNHHSLTQYAIEETFELVEAIELSNDTLIKEELGDVLFQVILHSQIAAERKAFNIYDVIQTLVEKMIRRHPHVFASTSVNSSQEVINNWEQIKNTEKTAQTPKGCHSTFELPSHLPALQTSYKIGKKSEKVQFDWMNLEDVFAKVHEEIAEVRAEIHSEVLNENKSYQEKFEKNELLQKNKNRIEEEVGDLLFSVSQLARHLQVEPETCLRKSNRKFEDRYFKMLSLAEKQGLIFTSLSLTEKEALWKQVKG